MSCVGHLPLISLIVPAYNASTCLEECVSSLLQQTYPRIEVIIVDDGSADGTGALADGIADRDDRVVVVHHPNNEGLPNARNSGIRVARGEYVQFVDADDRLVRDALDREWDARCSTQADAVCFDFSPYDSQGLLPRSVASVRPFPCTGKCSCVSGSQALSLLFGGDINSYSWTMLLPIRLLREEGIGFLPGLSYGEDTLFINRVLSNLRTVALLPEPLYRYRCGNGASASSIHSLDHAVSLERVVYTLDRLHSGLPFQLAERYAAYRVLLLVTAYSILPRIGRERNERRVAKRLRHTLRSVTNMSNLHRLPVKHRIKLLLIDCGLHDMVATCLSLRRAIHPWRKDEVPAQGVQR